MARPPKHIEQATGDVEDALAMVNQIDHNQRRIAVRTDDDRILDEVEDTRQTAGRLKSWLLNRYPGNEKRRDDR